MDGRVVAVTGGHGVLGRAVVEAALARGWRVKLSTDERGARYAGNFPAQVVREVVQQVLATAKNKRPFARPPWQWHRLWRHEGARR